MKLYLASRWANQEHLRTWVKPRIIALGHEVTSRWLDQENAHNKAMATVEDLEDVDRADGLVLWPDLKTDIPPYGGCFVEYGYAMKGGRKLMVIAPETSTCIFIHYHPKPHHFAEWADFFEALSEGKL